LMANSGHNNSHNSQPGHWSSFTALAGVYPLGFISWLIARTLRGQNSVQKPQPLQRDISISILKDLVALVSVSEDLSGNSVITIILPARLLRFVSLKISTIIAYLPGEGQIKVRLNGKIITVKNRG